ncbi:hypothetical protein COLO4_21792 [Corchorus olitorius]|uniref:Uncharacterized protein n=1 Tax=Corchorus olitorius TaxID=93759 RepID=A0A1R3IQZ3_9ROSI|nr:hypothetical protein COLO4_21792 [Corchorus olitorius]
MEHTRHITVECSMDSIAQCDEVQRLKAIQEASRDGPI